jgi:hypothetical protein
MAMTKSHSEPLEEIATSLLQDVIFGTTKVKERGEREDILRCLEAIKNTMATMLENQKALHQIVEHQQKLIDRIREFVPSIE